MLNLWHDGLYKKMDDLFNEVIRVLTVLEAVHMVQSLQTERETLSDIWTCMQKADELTRELLTVFTNSEAVQNDNKSRRSQLDKSVRNLSLAIAGIKASLEKPRARGGATAVGGAAG